MNHNKSEIMSTSNDSEPSTSAAVQQPIASDKLDVYNEFICWQKSRNINTLTEDTFIEFFREVIDTHPPNKLTKLFYTLKNRLQFTHKVNIMKFPLLMACLSENGAIHLNKTDDHPKSVAPKATINFSNDEICKFLTEAPDSEYLGMKAATVIGVHTKYSKFYDIRRIKLSMVTDFGTTIVVRIPHKGVPQVYRISGEFAAILRKYLQLRLQLSRGGVKTTKFFVHFQHGKCCSGAIGRGTIAKMAQQIANFLKLESAHHYTTDSFRTISPEMIGMGSNNEMTDGRRFNIPTCNNIGWTQWVAGPTYVGMKNATNTTDYDRISSPDVEDDAIDGEISQFHTVNSSSEKDEDAIECINQNHQDTIIDNCTATKQHQLRQLHPDVELLYPKVDGMVSFPDVSTKIVNMDPLVTNQMLRSKIGEQAREIGRLKQIVEKQGVENEILKDLLREEMKRSTQDKKTD